jgi:hypothetical protein
MFVQDTDENARKCSKKNVKTHLSLKLQDFARNASKNSQKNYSTQLPGVSIILTLWSFHSAKVAADCKKIQKN